MNPVSCGFGGQTLFENPCYVSPKYCKFLVLFQFAIFFDPEDLAHITKLNWILGSPFHPFQV